ncbi:anosmin-1-like [Plakobranchus ocellatus]|uniref:Anosmin-1-like n=1 Tax=Plakobranchus ocellatus TaxID=259542 RepID=A0AAV4B7Y5_9GAST|nr:anosmin-1-like [Plakobranchus ocellatus]
MKGLGTGLFLLWIIIIHEGSCNYAEILWGQCNAFCITQYHTRLKKASSPENLSLTAHSALRDCRKNTQCKWCLFACQRPKKDYVNHKDCLSDCQNSRTQNNIATREACYDGCNFIAKSLDSKHGNCPSPAHLSSLRSSCIEECQADRTCSGMSKCCNTTCGQICHRPVMQNVFPSMPKDLQFKERRDGGLLVEWSREEEPSIISPVVYILRWWCPYTEGVLYSITTRRRVRLPGYPDGVHPGMRCNYMLAAINIKGSVGFTSPVTYIKRFLKPSPPLNLERTRSKLHDGKVDLTVRWEPPEFTDGKPVDRYLVFWIVGLPTNGKIIRLPVQRKTVKAGRTSCTIPNLEPGVMYFVQVRAIVDWGGKTFRGRPASTYVDSYTSPQPPEEEDLDIQREAFISESRVYNIMVDEPMFVSSELTARVAWSLYSSESTVEHYKLYWTLDVCDGEAKHRKTQARLTQEATTYKQEFHMYGLESGCVYEVKIHTANHLGDLGQGQKQYFRTPPCHKTKGRTADVQCKSEVSAPLPPKALEVSYRSTCMCQAVVSWQRPDQIAGHTATTTVEAFSVRWGNSMAPSVAADKSPSLAVIYNGEPHSHQISGSESRACMGHLEPGKHYTVQVASIANGQKSSPAIRHFTTSEGIATCDHVEPAEDQLNNQRDFAEAIGKQTQVYKDAKLKTPQSSITNNRNLAAHSAHTERLITVMLCTIICLLSYVLK